MSDLLEFLEKVYFVVSSIAIVMLMVHNKVLSIRIQNLEDLAKLSTYTNKYRDEHYPFDIRD